MSQDNIRYPDRLQVRISTGERKIVEEGKEKERIETDTEFVRFLLHWYLVQARTEQQKLAL